MTNIEIKPWVVAGVIFGLLVAVAGYSYTTAGLPMMCYKDKQQVTPSPNGALKLVHYHWNCRKELFGIDFGPFTWAATGFEITERDHEIRRHGFPPHMLLKYSTPARTQANMELAPPVRVVWAPGTKIDVYHLAGTEKDAYPKHLGIYYLNFIEVKQFDG